MTRSPHAPALALIALIGTVALAQPVTLQPEDTMDAIVRKAANVTPSERQLAWQEREFTCFVHFGMNTFTDREWGEGTEDPALFNPTELDARQWVAACKAAGMSALILTAKHHDGFCLWPSAYTEHSVKNSPWKGGQGDVVREVSEACREAGLAFGIYVSPWDRHEPTYGDSPAYNQHFLDQLRELLTNYGEIREVWFDGACGEGPNGKVQQYDWDAYYALIRELQPGAAISVCGPDVRWCGNEAGICRESEWSVIPDGVDGQAPDIGSRDVLRAAAERGAALRWFPAQVNTSIRPGWFYHSAEDARVKSLDQLLDVYYGSVGGNGQFLLNVPPDTRGLFHENDVRRLEDVGKVLRATFDEDLAAGASATASAAEADHPASATTDGDPATYWTAAEGTEAATIEHDLGAPRTFNRASLREAIEHGQRIESFHLDAWLNGDWTEIARATVVGHKRLLRFDEATTDRVRFVIEESRVSPTLASFGLYRAPAVLRAPVIRRDLEGNVSIEAEPGVEVRYWVGDAERSTASTPYTEPCPLPDGGLVAAIAIAPDGSDVLALGGSALSRAEFGIAKAGWRVVSASSEEAPGEAAANAIDENPETIWHSRWREEPPAYPHTLTIDMGREVEVAGFTCLPRRNAPTGGSVVAECEFHVALDGETWGEPVARAVFDNIANNPIQQSVKLTEPVTARYFRFTALGEANGGPLASMAELGVLAPMEPPAVHPPKPRTWEDLKPDMPAEAVTRANDDFPLSDQSNASGWTRYDALWDEFDGDTLDAAKWWDRNPTWLGRQPAFFWTRNVEVRDGELLLSMRKEEAPEAPKDQGFNTYTSAAVQSKERVRYGYFEVRAKPMASAGSSSFWFYDSASDWWTEIDVFEIGGKAPGKERNMHITLHHMHSPLAEGHFSVGSAFVSPADLIDDYHVYGLEWDEAELRFYFDGVLVRRGPNTHWHQPLTLNFDSETMPEWFGLPEDAALPSTYHIDYIRVWKR